MGTTARLFPAPLMYSTGNEDAGRLMAAALASHWYCTVLRESGCEPLRWMVKSVAPARAVLHPSAASIIHFACINPPYEPTATTKYCAFSGPGLCTPCNSLE